MSDRDETEAPSVVFKHGSLWREGDGRCVRCAELEAENAALRAELNEIRGTPEARFHTMLHALLERFPDPSPAAAPPVELRILEAIDALRAERDATKRHQWRTFWFAPDELVQLCETHFTRAEAAESRLAAMEEALTAAEQQMRAAASHEILYRDQYLGAKAQACADGLAALRARLTQREDKA